MSGERAGPQPPFALAHILRFLAIYRGMLLLTYLGFVAIGLWATFAGGLPEQSSSMGLVIAGIGLFFGGLTVYGFTTPQSPWGWKVQAALLCLGVPLLVTTPLSLMIGWTWLHPGVRAAFGIAEETFPDE